MSKENNIKDKFKLALLSTAKAISDDFNVYQSANDKKKPVIDILELEKLENKNDFIKYRAESDSAALKKNFQILKFIKKIYQRTFRINIYMSCRKKLDVKC